MQATQASPRTRPSLSSTVRPFSPNALQPGDILLSCGDESLSILIQRLDGGDYSHSAVWDGAHAADAGPNGVVRHDLQYDLNAQWYLDAYRWHSPPPGSTDLGDPAYPYQPVITRNDRIVDAKTQFAYDELVMMGLVVAVSKQPDDKWLRRAVRILLSRLQEWVHEHITSKPGTTAMTCAETVAVSFDEAQGSKYEIQVEIDESRDYSALAQARPRAISGLTTHAFSSYDDLRQRYADAIAAAAPHTVRALQTRVGVRAGIPVSLPPGCVTPRDLQTSPNLRLLGRLSPPKPTPPAATASSYDLFVDVFREYVLHWPKKP